MDKPSIHLTDVARILLGEAPPEFLLEVAIRTAIMYVALLTIARLLGKRTNAMLTITERAVFITMGAMVSQPMQGPPNGIVNGFIALACMLFFQRMLTLSFFKNRRWMELVQGKNHIIVKDSVIDLKELHRIDFTRNQLFELLRNKKIRHLGQLKRVYIEACGTISIYRQNEIRHGLSILRPDEVAQIVRKDDTLKVCADCGKDQSGENENRCDNCSGTHWVAPSVEFVK